MQAQELRCQVSVNSGQIQGSNRQTFESMQKVLYEFMNNKKWTDNVYSNDERIECNISINLTSQVGSEKFIGTLQVQSRRPVYNTNYYTTMLNWKEKDNDFQFTYREGEPLDFSETGFLSNLTSVMAYYAYIIIGTDYDSFSSEGGSPYFQKAQSIVNYAQNTSEVGWKAYESTKNRYWLIENILNDIYSPIRSFAYIYHRLGLDVMNEKAEGGRAEIAESLKLLQKAQRAKPGSIYLQIIMLSKADEMVNIFQESYPDELAQVVAILNEIDPSNITKYQAIGKNK